MEREPPLDCCVLSGNPTAGASLRGETAVNAMELAFPDYEARTNGVRVPSWPQLRFSCI